MDYMEKQYQESPLGGIRGVVVPQQNQAIPVREVQMRSVAQRHGESMTRLQDVVDTLCRRLEPILRPSSPSASTGSQMGKPAEMQAPLVSAWNQVTDQVDNLYARLDDILGRLEI